MRFGIFLKVIERTTLQEKFAAVRSLGLDCVQFNLSCAGLPEMPDELDPAAVERIRAAAQAAGVSIAALSGTYNMIHPDLRERELGLRRLAVLAAACRGLGTRVLTLCTGTRDPENMWRRHPGNDAPDAWSDLLHVMERALRIAEEHQVVLAFEPEHANVVSSARRGRALLDAMRSPWLKVVMDGANLIEPGRPQLPLLAEAFDLLGPDLVLAHAKDWAAGGGFCAAGQGILDYAAYLRLLQPYAGLLPLVLHTLQESETRQCLQFLAQVSQ